jgi:chemotaxis protein CheX
MNVDYINPFLTSAITIFDKELGCTLTRGTPYVKTGLRPEHDVSGVIGLSGGAEGIVVLGLGSETAKHVAGVLLEERPAAIDRNVTNAVGKLANTIVGSAKAKFDELQLHVSLPTVITGKSHCVEFPQQLTPICVPFESRWGSVTVEVGLTEKPAE